MPPDRNDDAYAFDMLRYAKTVTRFVQGRTLDEFKSDEQFRLAVERAIEIIGEAARNISDEYEKAHPHIPWQKIVAQRHVLSHEYGDIIPEKLWDVATVRIPQLIVLLEPLVPPTPPDPESETHR